MFKTRYTGLQFKFKDEWKLGRIGTFIKSYDEDEEFGTKCYKCINSQVIMSH